MFSGCLFLCVCVAVSAHVEGLSNRLAVDLQFDYHATRSSSSMHHYECVALCKDISLQRGPFCARSLASRIPRSSEDRSS